MTTQKNKLPLSSVSVSEFGAVGDGRSLDHLPIQRAIDSGAGTIIIPDGIYIIGKTLTIPSDTRIFASKSAVIRFAKGAGTTSSSYLITNRNHGNGNRNIALDGGIWDGNCSENPRGREGDPLGYTGTTINFINVTNLRIENVTIRDPEAFSIRVGEVNEFDISNIEFDHRVIRPNQDGIHIGGFCSNGMITNIRALLPMATNDDMIAINADDDVERVINLGMRNGPIRNITIRDIYGADVYTFIRLLSNVNAIEDIHVSNVTGRCRALGINMNNWRFPIGGGKIRNVLFKNFKISKQPNQIERNTLVDISLCIENVTFEQMHVSEDHSEYVDLICVRNDTPFFATLTNCSEQGCASIQERSTMITIVTAETCHHIFGYDGSRLVINKGPIHSLVFRSGQTDTKLEGVDGQESL